MKQGDLYTMASSSIRAICAVSAIVGLSGLVASVSAQQIPAYDILPAETQAIVWVPDGQALVDGWDKTQLAKLAADPRVSPFFNEQRQEIEKRFVDAGWRLNVKPEDVKGFLTGQIAVSWMEVPETPRKPFAMSLLADVADDTAANSQLLAKIDKELLAQKATKAALQFADCEISKYTLPARPGQLLAQNTFYAIVRGFFIATDDEPLMHEIIGRIVGQLKTDDVLSNDEVFIAGRDLLKVSGEAQLEYFVRPLGFARVLRSIGGNRSKSNADMLAVLQNQGFGAIKCICGEVKVGGPPLDMLHRGYVYADIPLPMSAAILDFPNNASREVPNFVGKRIASLLVTNWNADEAFWKAEGLVDEIVGTKDVFKEVIEAIHKDTNGPQIDLANEVLPLFTNDIYSMSDSSEGPIDVNSRRNLIALKIRDTEKMANVIDRAMRNEPDTREVEFEGHTIWQVVQPGEDDDSGLDFGDDFGDVPTENTDDEQRWLSNWAITVYDGYLMFASHVEFIEEAITQAKLNMPSPLVEQPDFIRATSAIADTFGKQDASAWRVVRTDLALRVQYELFREGKIRQSQSMIASILDKVLQSDSEIEVPEQQVNGAALPPFQTVAGFLQPSAMLSRSTDNGWEFGSLLLSGPPANAQTNPGLDVSALSEIGTAHLSAGREPKR
ncbi:MAG: hypothetical protein KDB22_06520 [Planctomycetales bacterium]|nr:hypothetical protein [Planctomycetales bacterium]